MHHRLSLLCVIVALAACTSGSGGGGRVTGAAGTTGAAGDGASGGAGATGVAGTGAAAGTTGASGSGGTTGAAGSGGTTGAGGAGGFDGGAAGTGAATDGAASDGSATGAAAAMGHQDDPGTTGDGMFALPGPYALTDESTMHLDGAPAGQLLGPFLHAQTGTYTGWSTWKFTYWVYVPAQYKPGHHAALAVFQDGSLYVGDPKLSVARFNAPTVFDNLIASGAMPVTIGVFIDPGSSDGHHVGGGDGGRSKQYDTPNDQYGKFLIQEFLPAEILGKYDIVTDADGWAIGGHSSGGIAAFSVSWFYPDKFRKVITASPSFSNTGGTFPAKILTTTPAKPMRFYHMAGSNDLCCPSWFDQNNTAAKDLMQMGYHYRYRPGTGMHFPPDEAAQDFPDALRWLWRGYHAPL